MKIKFRLFQNKGKRMHVELLCRFSNELNESEQSKVIISVCFSFIDILGTNRMSSRLFLTDGTSFIGKCFGSQKSVAGEVGEYTWKGYLWPLTL